MAKSSFFCSTRAFFIRLFQCLFTKTSNWFSCHRRSTLHFTMGARFQTQLCRFCLSSPIFTNKSYRLSPYGYCDTKSCRWYSKTSFNFPSHTIKTGFLRENLRFEVVKGMDKRTFLKIILKIKKVRLLELSMPALVKKLKKFVNGSTIIISNPFVTMLDWANRNVK